MLGKPLLGGSMVPRYVFSDFTRYKCMDFSRILPYVCPKWHISGAEAQTFVSKLHGSACLNGQC